MHARLICLVPSYLLHMLDPIINWNVKINYNFCWFLFLHMNYMNSLNILIVVEGVEDYECTSLILWFFIIKNLISFRIWCLYCIWELCLAQLTSDICPLIRISSRGSTCFPFLSKPIFQTLYVEGSHCSCT